MAEYLDSTGLGILLKELYPKIKELGGSTQLQELPTVTADTFSEYDGKYFQYIGFTTDDYVTGHFYKVVQTADNGYAWKEVPISSFPDSTQIKFNNDERGTDTVYSKITDIEKAVDDLTTQQGIQDVTDDKKYMRTQNAWVEFDSVDGNSVKLQIKTLTSDAAYTPAAGEFIYLSDKNFIVLGDGTAPLANLQDIRNTGEGSQLEYIPENSANRGMPDGYAPLGADGKVPAANLPDNVTSGYTKAEVDQKVKDAADKAALDLNTEVTARGNADAQVQKNLDDHIADPVLHITATERDTWNAKLDASTMVDIDAHIANTDIHVTVADKNRWDGRMSARFVNSVAEMNQIDTSTLGLGDICYVKTGEDAQTGQIQADTYVWYGVDQGGWNKEDKDNSVVSVEWSGIKNGPNATVLQLEYAAKNAHNHANKIQLDQIAENAKGVLTYRGNEIGASVIYYNTDNLLPTEGKNDVLYVVQKDSSAFDQPTIRKWDNGKYHILCRVYQNTPAPITNTRLLQSNVTTTAANQVVHINVNKDSDYKYGPINILKQGPSGAAKTEPMVEPTSYQYDTHLINVIQGKVRIGDKVWFPEKYKVEDKIYYSIETDLSCIKNITQIL